jgi:hypothetical protein
VCRRFQSSGHSGYGLGNRLGARSFGGVDRARPFQHRAEQPELRRYVQGAAGPGDQSTESRVQGERDLPADGFHQHQSQGIDIGPVVEGHALQLLGSRIARCADQGADGLGPARSRQGPGDAEIGDARVALVIEQQVPGLDVAVDQAPGVSMSESGGNLGTESGRLGDVEPEPAVQQ